MTARSRAATWATPLTAAVAIGIIALSTFGYRATRDSQRSAEALLKRQESDGARLVTTALTRDMRGAQAVLADRDWGEFITADPNNAFDVISVAFARYPYPESFFIWSSGTASDITWLNRADRLPQWLQTTRSSERFPVVAVRNPEGAAIVRDTIGSFAEAHRQYAVFDTRLGEDRYQVVARLTYSDRLLEHLESFTGFTVNVDWARRGYFGEILRQASAIGDSSDSLDVAVFDEQRRVVSGALPSPATTQLSFPLLFADPATITPEADRHLSAAQWSVGVATRQNSPLLRTTRQADRLMIATAAAVCALGLALIALTRAMRAGLALSEMRSDFVASVTHDLKTPLAGIRVLADTLVQRRQVDAGTVREYASLMAHESKQLTRRVENLLAYARVTDVEDIYSFEPIALTELVDDILKDFRQQIASGGFDVAVEVSPELPLITGDRTSLMLAIGNLLDNAIRYSAESRSLRVAAERREDHVVIEVGDHGAGIPTEELLSVQRKFVRGRMARSDGSGLGLAIVSRVVADHRGSFVLDSVVGVGTIARIMMPVGVVT